MLYWALVFLVIDLIFAAIAFGGIEPGTAIVSKVLFLIFLVMFLSALVTGLVQKPDWAPPYVADDDEND